MIKNIKIKKLTNSSNINKALDPGFESVSFYHAGSGSVKNEADPKPCPDSQKH